MKLSVAALIVLSLVTFPVLGGDQFPFEAEVDCDGIFSGGESVPFLLEFSNRTNTTKNLSTTLSITIPGIGERTLIQRVVVMGPDTDRFINRNFNLPQNAPQGNYVMNITADDGTDVTFDTCSFNVVP